VHVLTAAPGAVPTTTFPHTERMQRRLGRLMTISADGCAERILRALDDGRHEVVAPAWYRPVVAFEACSPALATRVMRNRYL
jgi:short-subunit dehydrogenase